MPVNQSEMGRNGSKVAALARFSDSLLVQKIVWNYESEASHSGLETGR
jgi:hypothetical protein